MQQIMVKHNGTNITGFVKSYDRVHKICTGIGTLAMEVSRTIGRTFQPWDSIDVYENGDFKVRYYVSSVQDSRPRGTILLDCQDISKKLVDYFIPESYIVDYPSYTRYWIEKFLDEVDVSYEFNTTSQGTLLSNFTQLGLVTVYEQLINLLQMSGWYMYFDGTGKAIIGSLNVDLATNGRSVGKTDILSIMKTSNDKMLRNRAVVLGSYDGYRGGYASADVSVNTSWNYDHRDKRAVVISNSNIGDSGTAYGMANQIIKEFARITVEKHITVWGAKDFNLGDALRVTSNVWKGRGLITTFGVSMSKDGLVTNVVLDERCPRLFGYFDFGDYVYVATYGEGVWRKHIKYDPTWYNFSTGLTNLNITDMHINNGVFGSVGHSGELYYAIDNLPWHQITISSFLSSTVDSVISGELALMPFSGIFARAVTVDRMGNTVKFAMDNGSGMNMGDYGLSMSGWVSTPTTSGNRGWVVEYDVLAGDLTGTSYPISISGNYNLTVLDIDNDGKNDYVSVKVVSSGLGAGPDYDLGYHITQPFTYTDDNTSYCITPVTDPSEFNSDGSSRYYAINVVSPRIQNGNSLVAMDNQTGEHSKVMAVGKDGVARMTKFTKKYEPGLNSWTVVTTTTTSTANTEFSSAGGSVFGIYPNFYSDLYKIYYVKTGVTGIPTFYAVTWNAYNNTWGSSSTVGVGTKTGFGLPYLDPVVIGNTLYVLFYHIDQPGTSGGYHTSPATLYVDMFKIDMSNESFIQDHLLEFTTEQYGSTGKYYYFNERGEPTPPEESSNLNRTIFRLFQNGDTGLQIVGRTEIYFFELDLGVSNSREFLFYGNETTIQYNKIYDEPTARFGAGNIDGNSPQLTKTRGIINMWSGLAGDLNFVFNGTTFKTYTSTGSLPYYYSELRTFPIFIEGNEYYMAKNGTSATPYLFSAETLEQVSEIIPPTGYTFRKLCSNSFNSYSNQIYAVLRDVSAGKYCLVPYNLTSFDLTKKIMPYMIPSSVIRTYNFGNFFIEDTADYTLPAANVFSNVYYLDFGQPDLTLSTYHILRRTEAEFTIIETEAYPIRLDISNNTPVLTAGSGEASFVSNYVYDSELIVVEPTSLSGTVPVNDYRYTYLEPIIGGTSSGNALQTMILYVSGSGVYGADALSYSGGFSIIYEVPSGYGTRIETSNYGADGQYVFITASGNVQTFYQKNPEQYVFVPYSGMPQSRATIIRLDDAL